MNDSVRAFVDWSGEFEELYKSTGQWPQSKKWVGLTKEEIAILWKATPLLVGVYSYTAIALEVQAKLKEKNT